ncbi:MAG: hypothetical protein JWM19_6818 [Actinomycetia bacterium]|nr:hypothetical protein [Actinomycetes bacterium]
MCSRTIVAIGAEMANRRQSPFLAFGRTTHPACPSGWFSAVTYDADRVMLIIVVAPNSKSHGRKVRISHWRAQVVTFSRANTRAA